MESRIDGLEEQVRELGSALGRLESRVADLEAESGQAVETQLWPRREADEREDAGWLSSLVPLTGRSLLLLGGAFLLRAITDLEAVPNALGLLLGFLYALLLLFAGDRAAARSEGKIGATFYTIVGAIIAYPLVLEAVTRFGLLETLGASVAIAVASTALVLIAARRRLTAAAGAASLGAGLTCLALLRTSAEPTPLLIVLLALGLTMLWLFDREGWLSWKLTSAFLADLAFAILPAGLAAGRLSIEPARATSLLLALFTAYVVAFSARSLLKGKRTGLFEVAQTLVAGVIAFGGSWSILGADPLPGLTALVLGVAAYGIAFSPAVREDRRRSFFFFTSLGLVLIAVGSLQFLTADRAALVWSVLGIACALASARYERVTLSLHCTLYLLAALVASGLARTATAGYWLPDPAGWPPLRATQLVVIASLAASLAIPTARRSTSWGRLALVPRAMLLLFLVWAAGGALLALLAPRFLGTGQELDAGALATARTGLLAIPALGLAWLSGRRRFVEAGWLVYPLLAVAGLRVLTQDLQEGRPVTLFVSLALLGIALMASARWLRRGDSEGAPDS